MHLALKKLPARYVALMAAMTVNAPMLVPLERQLMEGAYLSDQWHRSTVRAWIGSSPDSGPRALALSHFEDYFRGVSDEG